MKLRGRTALVTGASKGIGYSIAKEFLRHGASVAIAARTRQNVDAAVTALAPLGRVIGVPADVCNQEDVEAIFDVVEKEFGHLDILVNNPGSAASSATADLNPAAWQRVIDTNLTSVFRVTVTALNRGKMLERRYGRIINMASLAGKQGVVMEAAYTASKHGVVGFTKSTGFELARSGITVNAICPGFVDTELTHEGCAAYARRLGKSPEQMRTQFEERIPIGRFIEPDEVAALALYLASDEAAAVVGQAWNICGGLGHY